MRNLLVYRAKKNEITGLFVPFDIYEKRPQNRRKGRDFGVNRLPVKVEPVTACRNRDGENLGFFASPVRKEST